jgi:hypothetical protein
MQPAGPAALSAAGYDGNGEAEKPPFSVQLRIVPKPFLSFDA